MIRVSRTNSMICSKKELRLIRDIFNLDSFEFPCVYELPLFTLIESPTSVYDIKSKYVLITGCNKLTEKFVEKVNKIWDTLYDSKNT